MYVTTACCSVANSYVLGSDWRQVIAGRWDLKHSLTSELQIFHVKFYSTHSPRFRHACMYIHTRVNRGLRREFTRHVPGNSLFFPFFLFFLLSLTLFARFYNIYIRDRIRSNYIVRIASFDSRKRHVDCTKYGNTLSLSDEIIRTQSEVHSITYIDADTRGTRPLNIVIKW